VQSVKLESGQNRVAGECPDVLGQPVTLAPENKFSLTATYVAAFGSIDWTHHDWRHAYAYR